MKFNIESPLFQFLTMLSEFVVLNVIFILSCIPLFTIGASLTALYSVTMQEARYEHGYIVKKYLKAWKQNFLQSTAVWLLMTAAAALLATGLIVYKELNSFAGNGALFILVPVSAFLVLCFLYMFPLLARFQNTIRQTFINSFLIAMTNLKLTALLVVLNGLYIALVRIIPWSKIFMVLLGFAFFAYCNSFLFIRVFKKYEPTPDLPEQI